MAFLQPLPHLDPQTRLLVRSVMMLFGRFLKIDNEATLIKTPDPVIFVFNHNNYWEILPVVSYLLTTRPGKKLAFVSDWMFGRLPFFRWFLQRIDPIYTYRKTARFAVLDKHQEKADGEAVCQACVDRLQNRQNLGIFPEGTRNQDPHRLRRGRKGVGEIVLKSGVPVLPAGIDFPQRITKGRIPFFSPIILRFGSPLIFPEEGAVYQAVARDTRCSSLERRKLHLFLNARVTHRIMEELARLSGKAYPYAAPKTPAMAQQFFENISRKGASL